ncbi:hypothetical protein F2P56_026217 [Juglans regia]|uniref:UPF0481 protein At3g02645 n=2 Tax=Juglans regia TaxID=51240 RepID=A0A2I4ES36_JUGRE|nr:putative UPF0481 protein At3g02645 [Juglans regia]KAF5456774.1 hypothetical protein F2P56_026217 [Juglans regia]
MCDPGQSGACDQENEKWSFCNLTGNALASFFLKATHQDFKDQTKNSNIELRSYSHSNGLEAINFDNSCGTFYLSVIHLDDNSEVVLRNLVAYEACIAPEVMVLTRYAELMNRIIDSEEDVKILREAAALWLFRKG